MALIPPFFLDCVVAIGFPGSDGKKHWSASGFLFGHFRAKVSETESLYGIYIVTNRHVFDGKRLGYVRFNPEGGKPAREFDLQLLGTDDKPLWFTHTDSTVDVAAQQINAAVLDAERIKYHFFQSDKHVMSLEKAKHSELTEGDGVYALGFPMGLTGGDRNYVIVRQGTIARVRDTLEGISKDILIDLTILPGNSGGPVVTRPEAMAIQGTKSQNSAGLLGIVSSYLPYTDVAYSAQTNRPRVVFEENSGLAAVVPIDFAIEVIQQNEKSLQQDLPMPVEPQKS